MEIADGVESLGQAVKEVDSSEYARLVVCEPEEYRLREAMEQWSAAYDMEVEIHKNNRFLCSIDEFNSWADGHKQLRMEFFYRYMRKEVWCPAGGTGQALRGQAEFRCRESQGLAQSDGHSCASGVGAGCN